MRFELKFIIPHNQTYQINFRLDTDTEKFCLDIILQRFSFCQILILAEVF